MMSEDRLTTMSPTAAAVAKIIKPGMKLTEVNNRDKCGCSSSKKQNMISTMINGGQEARGSAWFSVVLRSA